MLKQSLIIYGGFVYCASVSGAVGDYEIQRFWKQVSYIALLISARFWDITRHRVVIVCRRFGTTYQSHLQGPRVRGGKKAGTVTYFYMRRCARGGNQ
jgi:hypothetical protein